MARKDDFVENAFVDITEGVNWGYSLAEITQQFWHTNDETARKFLAGIVLDELRPADMRLAAYCALFEVSGRDLWTLPDAHEFKMPEDLDLPFLHECLTEKQRGRI